MLTIGQVVTDLKGQVILHSQFNCLSGEEWGTDHTHTGQAAPWGMCGPCVTLMAEDLSGLAASVNPVLPMEGDMVP